MDTLDLGATIRSFIKGQNIFGRYSLIKTLGRGGMGIVWLARDNKLERDVALKFLPEMVAQDARAIEDLKRETRRSLELTHPNIIRIYDFIDDDRTAAISMEYVEGDNLSKRCLEYANRVIPLAELSPLVKQLCEALTYAHTKAKIVHLDLKPANLMLDAVGDLKVADFGIAASISDSVSRVSQTAGSSGTPVYMSPQQMMGEPPAVTDDIYALGATLFELLTGKPPFYTGNIFMQVNDKVAPPVNERRLVNAPEAKPVPPTWEATVAACLAKKAEDRPKSAAEVWRRLNESKPAAGLSTKDFEGTPAATRNQEPEDGTQQTLLSPSPDRKQPETTKPETNIALPTAMESRQAVEVLKDTETDTSLVVGGIPLEEDADITANPTSIAAGASSLSDKTPAEAATSVISEHGDTEPVPTGRRPRLKLSRRSIVVVAGVTIGVAAAVLLAFARFGNPIYMPDEIEQLAVDVGNPRTKIREVPRQWTNLCRAWDTWLVDLQGNGGRLLRTKDLWEPDDPLRKELENFMATAKELRPEALVPEAANEKRLGALGVFPPAGVQYQLQTPEVSERLRLANHRLVTIQSRLETWPRWDQLRALLKLLEERGFTSTASALTRRLPPARSTVNYKFDIVRTLKLFNDVSLDSTGTLLLSNRWGEISRLITDMEASGDRVQQAMPALILSWLGDCTSIGEFADSLAEPLAEMRRRRAQYLDPLVDRERFLKESPLQMESAPVSRADFVRWEKELGHYRRISYTVIAIEGKVVMRKRLGRTTIPVRVGDILLTGDKIGTGEKSRATLRITDGTETFMIDEQQDVELITRR